MVGKMVKLLNGYSFSISDEGQHWLSRKIYSNINQAHAVMLSVMEFGNFSDWTVQIIVRAPLACARKDDNKELVLV